jgi:signal transduction histidine kinase
MTGFGGGLLIGLLAAFAGVVLLTAANRRRIADLHRRADRADRQAEQADRLGELGLLTGGLAHEIKNPLSTVNLNLQLLQEDLDRDGPTYERLIHRLATVQRETARMRDILHDFLRYAGKIELSTEPARVDALLEELVDFFAPQAQLNRAQIRLQPSPGPVTAEIDVKLIKQAVLNLMINALQAMPGGGELILSTEVANGDVIIHVIDTGSGIPPEAIEKIFNAYYSTKRGGSGLGLAMTQRIIHEHGGEIRVTSEVGKGSDFAIHLPEKQPHKASSAASERGK